jgi:phage gp29-like protein
MLLENANYLKKLKGILQVINKGASNEEQAEAEDAAANAIRDNYLITSDNLELKLNQLTATGGAGFKEYMDMLQNEETIAVLGQANTTQLPKSGGSRAALQVQKMISADIFYKDMIRVEKLMNDYLLLDYRLNYDANASLSRMPYQFRFNLEEEQDIEKNAIAIREVLNSGISLKKSEVYQKLGFSVPGKDDDIIASPAIATTSI